MKEYAWLLALAAGGTAAWSQIKSLFHQFYSRFVVEAKLDMGYAHEMVMNHLWTNFTRTKFGPRSFLGLTVFIKKIGTMQVVLHEKASGSMLFFDGWKPVFLKTPSKQGSPSGNMSGGNEVDCTLSFIRGTFNLEKFLSEAEASFNQNTLRIGTNKRYKVVRVFGTLGQEGQVGNQYPTGHSISSQDAGALSVIPLNWTREELGEISSESPFESLHYDETVMGFLKDVQSWFKSKEWYKQKLIPWKFGALLKGLPGTGKTSFCRAVAQQMDIPVHIFDLPSMTNQNFVDAWKSCLTTSPCMVLIEDVDRIFDQDKNLKSAGKQSGLTMDCILNCIDGIEEANGVLVIATANDETKIDPALTRDGRLGKQVMFSPISARGKNRLAERILSDVPHLVSQVVKEGERDTGAQFISRCTTVALREKWK